MNEHLHTDKSFHEKLENFSVEPPAHVWERIQGHMAMQKRKRRMAYVGWISTAAVVIFAFLAGWYFSNKSDEIIPETVQQNTMQSKTGEKGPGQQKEETNFNIAEETGITEVGKNEEARNTVAEKKKEDLIAEVKVQKTFAITDESSERYQMGYIMGKESALPAEEQNYGLAERKNRKRKETLTKSDEILVAENVKTGKEVSGKDNKWILGMYLVPGYSSHVASHSDQYSQNMTYSGESGNNSMGGGFSLQYKTSKKLRIESGIYYAQNGQRSGNSPNLFALGNNADYAAMAPEKIEGDQPTFSNNVRISSSGMMMNSTAGVIKMDKTPKGAEVTTNLEAATDAFSNTMLTNGEFSQVFEFVEIPLYMRYSILNKKIGLEVMGGFNAGLVVGNNAYIENEYGLQNIGSTEDISTLNLSGTVGLGVNYSLGKHLSLAVEPRLNYYLNSINTSSQVDYRPYRIGVYTGLYYEF